MGKGWAQISKMGVFLTHSHLDIRAGKCTVMDVILALVQCSGEVWNWNAKLVEQRGPVRTKAAKKSLGCSKVTGNAV